MSTEHKTWLPTAKRVDAVVIGASAGGVEALGVLLPRLPAVLPVAIIVVVHVPPDGRGELARLFDERCGARVLEPGDKEPALPGAIYFAPAGYHLLLEQDKVFSLSVDEPVNYSRPSIDVLFESASWTYGARLLGVLLTGASADGASGLRTIRQGGGHAWVQSPETARAAVMPQAAIDQDAADEILTLPQMAERLIEAFGRGRA
ncbi:chemotaxis protein CheB [Chitinasiproducens palmae]|uniref:protein-glutamate methylesterase n=1 Tax=Chitinasiproducens palmae TaxID=1770053 RepID=A0A1H2PP49_9BURK|nr:chemotaxis protein CheB [Chitinasiproducens palmae]SDV48466.1 two-component system, chemotaxis family, response regulator CheB [Chitinasiproducens palmae]